MAKHWKGSNYYETNCSFHVIFRVICFCNTNEDFKENNWLQRIGNFFQEIFYSCRHTTSFQRRYDVVSFLKMTSCIYGDDGVSFRKVASLNVQTVTELIQDLPEEALQVLIVFFTKVPSLKFIPAITLKRTQSWSYMGSARLLFLNNRKNFRMISLQNIFQESRRSASYDCIENKVFDKIIWN